MIKFTYKILITFLVLIFLNSCSDLKKGIGLEKDSPNEFLIEKRESLILPPDYKLLPPDEKLKENKISSVKDAVDKSLNNKKTENSSEGISDLEKKILNQIK